MGLGADIGARLQALRECLAVRNDQLVWPAIGPTLKAKQRRLYDLIARLHELGVNATPLSGVGRSFTASASSRADRDSLPHPPAASAGS